jgi:hypothetical protein
MMTEAGVIMGETNLWPLPSSLSQAGSRIVKFDGVKQAQLSAYLAGPEIVTAMARFLIRLFLTPRAQVANYRNEIWLSFHGEPGPTGTPERFLLKEGLKRDASGVKGLMGPAASREMMKIHLAAVRRIREQILPANPSRPSPGPKLPSQKLGACPFGAGCLYLTYGTVFQKFLSTMDEDPKSYVMFNTRSPCKEGYIYKPTMMPTKIHTQFCTCPYDHLSYDVSASEEVASRIVTAMCRQMDRALWHHANDALMSANEQIVAASKPFYSLESIRAALANLSEDERILRLAFGIVASLDNVSDPKLVPPTAEQRQQQQQRGETLSIYGALNDVCLEDLAQWRENENPNVELPYLANFDYRALLKLTPGKKTAASGRAASLREALHESNTQMAETELEEVETALAEVKQPAPAAGAPQSTAPPARAKSPEPEPEPEVVHGGRGPIHGRRFIPRLISDSYLEEKGFRFSTLRAIENPEEADDYVYSCLLNLYATYIPNFDPPRVSRLTDEVYLKYNGNPFALFDEGQAYLPLYHFVPLRDAY